MVGCAAILKKVMERSFFAEVEALIPDVQRAVERLREGGNHAPKATFGLLDILAGCVNQPVLVAHFPGSMRDDGRYLAPNRVEPDSGLILGDTPISDILSDGRSFEWCIATLFLGKPPTEEQEAEVRQALAEARRSFYFSPTWRTLSQRDLAQSCPDPFAYVQAVLAMASSEDPLVKLLRLDGATPIAPKQWIEGAFRVVGIISVSLAGWYRRQVRGFHDLGYSFEISGTDSTAAFLASTFTTVWGTWDVAVRGKETSKSWFRLTRGLDLLLATMIYHGSGNLSTECAKIAHSGLLPPINVVQAMISPLSAVRHGAAARLSHQFLHHLWSRPKGSVSDETLRAILKERTQSGRDIHGVGHRVVTNDRRTEQLRAFLFTEFPDHPGLPVMERWYELAVQFLQERAQVKGTTLRCGTNVDAYTGAIVSCLGLVLKEQGLDLVSGLFVLSRSAGSLAECFWDAYAYGKKMPLIRLGQYQLDQPLSGDD